MMSPINNGFGRDTLSHIKLHIKKGEKVSLVALAVQVKPPLQKWWLIFTAQTKETSP